MTTDALFARKAAAAPAWFAVAAVAGALLLAGLFGLLAGTGNLFVSAMLVGVIGTALALGSPRLLLWITVIGSLVLVGLLELYLPGLQFVRWIFPVAATLFLGAVVLERFWSRKSLPRTRHPALMMAVIGFVMACAVSTALNWKGAASAIIGWKDYFQVWGLFFGLALVSHWAGMERRLSLALLLIGLIQLPFALHQYFFLAPLRGGGTIVPVDVVAGTFGASFEGGGNNAVLAMFVVIVATVALALWRRQQLRGATLVIALPVLLAPIFLNESKVSVLYVLLGFLIVFRREVARRPLRFVAMMLGMGVLALGLVLSYAALRVGGQHETPMQMVERIIKQNTQEGYRYGSAELNRTTAVTHWWAEQRRHPLTKTLFGHGLASAKERASLLESGNNLAALRYAGMGIGVTTFSSLLWDVGVVGLAALLGVYVAAFAIAGRLARANESRPGLAGLFEGVQGAVAILALSLLHKNFFTFQLGYQVVTVLVLGFLVYASRHLVPAETSRAEAPLRTRRA